MNLINYVGFSLVFELSQPSSLFCSWRVNKVLMILSGFVSFFLLGARVPALKSKRREVEFIFGLILAMTLAFC